MIIRTVTVSGITEVNFDPEGKLPYFYASNKFAWIKNKSDAAVYVSLDESCVADADGTAQIGAGEAGMIVLSPENKIYISGDGDVEIRTNDTAECPFKIPGKGGGGSGTSDYAELNNKPKINNITLSGNKSWSDLGLHYIAPGVVAEEFDSTKNYSVGDYVTHGDVLYVFTAEHSGAWDDNDAEIITIMGEISAGSASVHVVDEPTAAEIAASVAEIWG